jgi:hypothetical protein
MIADRPRHQITELPALINHLPAEDRACFARLYHLSVTDGQAVPPAAMHSWIASHFGSVDAVRRQRIVKVTNRVTLEGALFNDLRAKRPLDAPATCYNLEQAIQSSAGGPFCHPETGTPADTFGRIRGKYALTASNVAKYDGSHGVIIFDEHDPLRFTAEQVADYLDTAQQWAHAAHWWISCYPFFLWNCPGKRGPSSPGHAQITLTRAYYARVEGWRQRRSVAGRHGCNCFADDALYHASTWPSTTVRHHFPSLTPYKEKESSLSAQSDEHLKSALFWS